MFKRVLIAFVTVILLSSTAYADVIYYPINNFFTRHEKQTTLIERKFIANGDDGGVAVKYDPDDKNIIAMMPNGEEMYGIFVFIKVNIGVMHINILAINILAGST